MNIGVRTKDGMGTDGPYAEWVKETVRAVLEEEGLPAGIEVAVYITDDMEMRSINQKYRGVDRTTDVLSFPINDLEKPLRDAMNEGFKPEYNMEDGSMALGDIVISLPRAERQAEQYMHSLKREFKFLIIHGMLHLLGYDHMEKRDERVMRDKQKRILQRTGQKI